MENAFCVILSKYRLYQGIALYHSLEHNYKNFKMFILCVDDETYQICDRLHLRNAILLKTEMLQDNRLAIAKQNRRLNEYCWTLKPFFLKYVLDKYSFINNAVYLDADIYFFNDPSPIFNVQSDYRVLLSKHDFLEKDSMVEKTCGKYNSGFIVFKRCKTSIDVLNWWEEKCIEWCYDSVDNDRFGDQKYLDLMPHLFPEVKSLKTPGVNIAPWNEGKYSFQLKGHKVYINKDKLICYHFCGLRLIDKNSFSLLIGNQKRNALIHTPYILAIQKVISLIRQFDKEFNGYYLESHFRGKAKLYKISR